jgi:hypothetical protein
LLKKLAAHDSIKSVLVENVKIKKFEFVLAPEREGGGGGLWPAIDGVFVELSMKNKSGPYKGWIKKVLVDLHWLRCDG